MKVATSEECYLAASIDKIVVWMICDLPGFPGDVVAADQLFFDLHEDRTIPPPPLGKGSTGVYIPWKEDRPAHAGLDRWK